MRWPPSYPNSTAEYFLTLNPALTGNAPDSQPQTSKKSLNDIYMGVDVWGRGSHGGGGFGSYKAITHIAPDSLGLSVALFGQGWTWESEQDKPGWNWDKWWEYDRKLWVGPVSGEVEVPQTPRREGEPECPHGPFQPIASFFPRNPPPDPFDTLDISCPSSEEEDAMFRCIWVPIQTVSVSTGKSYEATLYYKVNDAGQADIDLGMSVKPLSADDTPFEVQHVPVSDVDLPGGWTKISIQLSVPTEQQGAVTQTGAIGLVVAIVAEDAAKDLAVKIRVGQLNVYAIPPLATAVHSPTMLWANFATSASKDTPGTLSWEVAASFQPLTAITVNSPDDPVSAFTVQPSNIWFPRFMYYNVYGILYSDNDHVGQPEEAIWIGTTGFNGRSNSFEVVPNELPFWSEVGAGKAKVRFYIRGVTYHGSVLEWEKCVFVDYDLSGLLA
ncbi:hypothetical protein C0991_003013 [Blastosporella zonata]|nr:hypothetical protein C0991_003013 [Blastosporella zonata]